MKKSPSSEKSSSSSLSDSSSPDFTEFELRVRYSETDRMGIAHNKSYFEWFEIARTEFCRAKGISYADIERKGFYLVVVEAQCRYKKALRYDDPFITGIRLIQAAPKRLIFEYRIFNRDRSHIVAEGRTVHVVTNAQTEVVALPASILEIIRS